MTDIPNESQIVHPICFHGLDSKADVLDLHDNAVEVQAAMARVGSSKLLAIDEQDKGAGMIYRAQRLCDLLAKFERECGLKSSESVQSDEIHPYDVAKDKITTLVSAMNSDRGKDLMMQAALGYQTVFLTMITVADEIDRLLRSLEFDSRILKDLQGGAKENALLNHALGVERAAVLEKQTNPTVGVSLGNPVFKVRTFLERYLDFATRVTPDGIARVVIADSLHKTNLRWGNGYTESRAMKVALRHGDDAEERVRKAARILPTDQSDRLRYMRWDEACASSPHAEENDAVLTRAFETNREGFRDVILAATGEVVAHRRVKPPKGYTEKEAIVGLAGYLRRETAVFTGGYSGVLKRRDGLMYPTTQGLSRIVDDLQNGTSHPGITKDLQLENGMATVVLN